MPSKAVPACDAAAIDRLVASGSFATTHVAIPQLAPYFDAFTAEDVEKLLRGGLDNDQIRWIASDTDVRHFYTILLDAFAGQIDAEIEAKAGEVFRVGNQS